MQQAEFIFINAARAALNFDNNQQLDVDTRILTQISMIADLITGVPNYMQVSAQRVAMRNEALRVGLVSAQQALLSVQQTCSVQQEMLLTLMGQLTANDSADLDRDGKLAVLAAQVELLRVAGLATQSRLEANAAADLLRDARADRAEARQAATEKQLAANTAADLLRDARLANDEQLLTAAQARADLAESDAQKAAARAEVANQAAATAQATADNARAAAATNATALAALQTDVASRLPTSAVRRQIANTPAVTLAVGTPATVAVNFATPFADANYLVFLTKASGAALLNVQVADINKTAGGFTLTLQTTGLVSAAIGASSVEVFVIHV